MVHGLRLHGWALPLPLVAAAPSHAEVIRAIVRCNYKWTVHIWRADCAFRRGRGDQLGVILGFDLRGGAGRASVGVVPPAQLRPRGQHRPPGPEPEHPRLHPPLRLALLLLALRGGGEKCLLLEETAGGGEEGLEGEHGRVVPEGRERLRGGGDGGGAAKGEVSRDRRWGRSREGRWKRQ